MYFRQGNLNFLLAKIEKTLYNIHVIGYRAQNALGAELVKLEKTLQAPRNDVIP